MGAPVVGSPELELEAEMAKKPKPLHNEYELGVLSRAVRWTAFIQVRPLERIREERLTREEAEEVGALMAEHFGRPILIYGIDAAGLSAHATTIPAPSRMPAPGLGANLKAGV